MPFRPVEAQNVHNRLAVRRIDKLTNAEQRLPARDLEETGNPVIGSCSVDFLISVADFHFILQFEENKQ